MWQPDGDVQQNLVEFRMTVHLFVATSPTSCVNFALRKTAEDNKADFPAEVTNTNKNNFYVDDCLKSISSKHKAIEMVRDLTALCQKGGFMLSKWIRVLQNLYSSIKWPNYMTTTYSLRVYSKYNI